jgi:hypothetical protein
MKIFLSLTALPAAPVFLANRSTTSPNFSQRQLSVKSTFTPKPPPASHTRQK